MNAIMTFASAVNQMQRYDAVRRRNAEHAYHRQADYNGRNQKTLDDLEALLLGKKEPDAGRDYRELKKLDAGQVKQIGLQKREQLQIEVEVNRAKAEAFKVASMDLPSDLEREVLLEQKRFAKAISAYSIQVEAKRNGFIAEWPSVNKIA